MPFNGREAKRKLVRHSLVAKTFVHQAQKLCFSRRERLYLVYGSGCQFSGMSGLGEGIPIRLTANFVEPVEKADFGLPDQPEITSASVGNYLADRPLVQNEWIDE
ncbi:hypothetical protein DR64_1266 [Paraburkholderia xenovorans LB400]|nr:hypothetical protein DR64_1266 [Paraburkholderia xenovorans LB400]